MIAKISDKNPVVVEREFDATTAQIWKAITDKDEMKKWYFDLPEFTLEKNTFFGFWGGTPDCQYQHICEILEIETHSKLTYSWRYDGYAGISFVSFELVENNNKTLLRLTHSDIESFPKEIADFGRENFVDGWNAIIGCSLKEYLEKLK